MNAAWFTHVQPHLSDSRKDVINALILFIDRQEKYPTTKQLAKSMNKSSNEISGRLTELVRFNIIKRWSSRYSINYDIRTIAEEKS